MVRTIIHWGVVALLACLPPALAGCGGSDAGTTASTQTAAADQAGRNAPPTDSSTPQDQPDPSADPSPTRADSSITGDSSATDAGVSHDIVLYFARSDQIGQAQNYLTARVADNSSDIWVRYDLAMTYQAAGDLQRAAGELATALAISENPLLYAKLGNLYLMLGQPVLAQQAFGNAARLDPAYAGSITQRQPVTMNSANAGG